MLHVRRSISGCSLFAVLASTAVPAGASCVAPKAEVVWSMPAQGDDSVPIDADYWPEVTADFSLAPSLGGVELQPNGLGGFDLGELQPNTRYTIEHPDTDGVIHEIDFETGADSSPSAAPKPVIEGVSTTQSSEASEDCGAVLRSWGCFDTGTPIWYRVEVPKAGVEGWLVQFNDEEQDPYVLEAECGPSWFGYFGFTCVRVAALAQWGVSEWSDWYCADEAPMPVSSSDPTTPAPTLSSPVPASSSEPVSSSAPQSEPAPESSSAPASSSAPESSSAPVEGGAQPVSEADGAAADTPQTNGEHATGASEPRGKGISSESAEGCSFTRSMPGTTGTPSSLTALGLVMVRVRLRRVRRAKGSVQ